MLLALLILCVTVLTSSSTVAQCQPSATAEFSFPPVPAPGLRAKLVFGGLTTPRGIQFDSAGNLLVIERGIGVTALTPKNDASCQGWFRTVVLPNTALTQGIQVDGTKLYVSSIGQVLHYVYNPSGLTTVGSPVVIVDGLPLDGDLTTRTLLIEQASPINGERRSIIVSDGPFTNVDFTASDPASGRSQVRRFFLGPSNSDTAVPSGGYNWLSGELLAFGIRNGAGLAFGPVNPQQLWVVENGASLNDYLSSADDIANQPADELELVDLTPGKHGKFYGFPFCHTGFNLMDEGVNDLGALLQVRFPGDQFSINATTGATTAWCRNPANNVAPALPFQAHSVPLDIKFFAAPSGSHPGAFPGLWNGDGFVSFHGSFSPPNHGYGVVRVPFSGSNPTASPHSANGYTYLVQAANLTACPSQCIRPVNLEFGKTVAAGVGRLFVSSDTTGEVFFLETV